MSKPVFTWNPDLGAKQSVKPEVHQTRFGDGYEVRVTTAINSKPKRWDLQFTKPVTEAAAILAFLEARGATESFAWTDPMNQAGTYVCREWSSTQQAFGVYQVTATFEQVFEF